MNLRYKSAVLFLASFAALAPAQSPLNPNPSRVIGQASLELNSLAPNLVEGRELAAPGGIAIDAHGSPPILYVSDTGNNRVLAWRNAEQFANGAPADKVIGQKDRFSTFPQGPGRGPFSTGMTGPAGLAVDAAGNLYVVDAGNNRILRFPTPFQLSGQPLPDLVIGQPTFSTRGTNQGGISASSMALNSEPDRSDCLRSNCYNASLVFDQSGNLYFTDALNNRVLRYSASVLSRGAPNGPAADLVLGQIALTRADYNDDMIDIRHLRTPSGIAYDSAGRLYVSDSLNRVVIYLSPFQNGKAAARFVGIPVQQPNQQPPPLYSDSRFNGAEGLAMVNGMLAVADIGNSRIVIFPPYEQWTSHPYTQRALYVIGQPDFTSHLPNRGLSEAGPGTLSAPTALAFFNGAVYVTDTLNNRVLVFSEPPGGTGNASRVLGQDQFNYSTANRIEGRELHLVTTTNSGSFGDGQILIDTKSNPPHLYIADSYNNRVLGFRDATTIKTGATADLVIGQPDLFHSMINAPGNEANRLTDQGLRLPTGLALDSDGNLYVVDSLNGRVLRFPKPFEHGSFPHADLVIGQANFSSRITDPTPNTMNLPYGLTFTAGGSLLVSDAALNRMLLFAGPASQFVNGMAATRVFGQPNFASSASGREDNRMYGPRHIAIDSNNRLYVTDTGNSRIQIFDNVAQSTSDPRPVLTLRFIARDYPLRNPRGIYVNQ